MKKVALLAALVAVMSMGIPARKAPKIVPQMYASLRYDWLTDAVLWLEVRLRPFVYLYNWSGRTP